MNKMYRQGDVLVREVTAIPTDAQEDKTAVKGDRVILAEGEATGHHHSVSAQSATLLQSGDGKRWLSVAAESVSLTHQEHNPIKLDKGCYEVVGQREYTPEAIRRVAD